MGRNHVVTAVSLTTAAGAALYSVSHAEVAEATVGSWWTQSVQPVLLSIWDWLVPADGFGIVIYAALSFGALWLGSLVPDIDQRGSHAGRYVRRSAGWLQRRPHRGVTHTDWFWLGLLALSLVPGLRWVFFGWLGAQLHLEFDGLSRAGRVRWYPLARHKVITWGGRDMVVPDRYVTGGYVVGERSETWLVVLVVVCCVVVIAGSGWLFFLG